MAILVQSTNVFTGVILYIDRVYSIAVLADLMQLAHSLNVWSAAVREGDCGKLCKSVQEGNWPGASIESDTDGFQQGSRLFENQKKTFFDIEGSHHITSYHLQSATPARRMFRLHFQYFAEQEQNELRLILPIHIKHNTFTKVIEVKAV